jgi:hypothetical protein
VTAPVYPGAIAGYCSRCGAPLSVGHGPFCRTCGNRVGPQQQAAAYNYSYPVVPSASVPAAQHKLGHSRFIIFGALTLGVLVVLITAVAVSLKPTVNYCHFSCGPDVGPRLLGSTSYQSSQFGYRVEYDPTILKEANAGATGVQLNGPAGFMIFQGSAGQNVTGAMSTALGTLNTNVIQSQHSLSTVIPGAEIGFIPGSGQVYTATYVPPNGGQSQPVSIAVMAATNGQFTISVIVVGIQDTKSVEALPFGFADNSLYDYSISNTVWPGQT